MLYKSVMLFKKNIMKLMNAGAIHVILGSFFTKFVTFFGSIFIVRVLSKTDYGILTYYENFISYFTIMLGLGMAAGLTRYMVLADGIPCKKQCFDRAIYRGTMFNISLLFFSVLFIYYYPHPIIFRNYIRIGAILIFGLPFIYFVNLSLSTLRAEFKHHEYAYLALITSFILVVGRVVGAIIGGLLLTVYGRMIAEIVCAILSICIVYKMFFRGIKAAKLERTFKREMDIYSFQIMLTDGLWAIFMLNDLFLLGQLSGNETMIADYKVAFVIPANLAILTSAIGVFVAPYFTKYEKNKDMKSIVVKSSLVLKTTSLLLGVAVLMIFIFARQVVLLLFGVKYLSALPIMRILLIASFFNNGIRATIANILSAMGFQKINLAIAALGFFMQIVLGLYFIPKKGAMGAAYTTLVVYFFMSLCLICYFWNKYYRASEV